MKNFDINTFNKLNKEDTLFINYKEGISKQLNKYLRDFEYLLFINQENIEMVKNLLRARKIYSVNLVDNRLLYYPIDNEDIDLDEDFRRYEFAYAILLSYAFKDYDYKIGVTRAQKDGGFDIVIQDSNNNNIVLFIDVKNGKNIDKNYFNPINYNDNAYFCQVVKKASCRIGLKVETIFPHTSFMSSKKFLEKVAYIIAKDCEDVVSTKNFYDSLKFESYGYKTYLN